MDFSIRAAHLPTRQEKTIVYLTGGGWLEISPDGHYRGSTRVDRHLVYVVQTTEGQKMFPPAQFAEIFGWQNDPSRVWQFVNDER